MNNWFNKLKFRFQRYAITNLAVYASICFAFGYIMISTGFGTAFYFNYLAFFPNEVLHGQIWRIFTAIIFPPYTGSNVFMAALQILIYFSFASAVEKMMGEFEYNVYFFGSILIGEIGTLAYYFITGDDMPFLPTYTHFAVFMALAIMFADAQVLLFFLIPLKIKYLAVFEVLIYVYQFFRGSLYTKVSIIAAFIPVIIFYMIVSRSHGGSGNIFKDIKRNFEQKKRRREWQDQWR